jgi:putative SOS response-associated peptidase YedK
MCARYTLLQLEFIRVILGINIDDFEAFSETRIVPRFNITPNQVVPIVKVDAGRRKMDMVKWGFAVTWSKRPIFNAAGETVFIKPTFRESFKTRRCLIPANGFYDWPNKQLTLIRYRDDRPFFFAGLWRDDTMTMITASSNEFMRPIHPRMPSILRDADYEAWLDPESSPDSLRSMIVTREWDSMRADPVEKLTPDKP